MTEGDCLKYLIVNADDFGASRGINRGILEAHQVGIVTSASLFMDRAGTSDAVALAQRAPQLSVGLHADLDGPIRHGVRAELVRQLTRFEALLGRPPSHLDSHHHVHRSPEVLPDVRAVAEERGLVVRDFSPVRYLADFYGQPGEGTDLDRISLTALIRLIRTEVREGWNELGCHPGYVDADLVSRYTIEREHELRTLVDPAVREAIREAGIVLASFKDVPRQRV